MGQENMRSTHGTAQGTLELCSLFANLQQQQQCQCQRGK